MVGGGRRGGAGRRRAVREFQTGRRRRRRPGRGAEEVLVAASARAGLGALFSFYFVLFFSWGRCFGLVGAALGGGAWPRPFPQVLGAQQRRAGAEARRGGPGAACRPRGPLPGAAPE